MGQIQFSSIPIVTIVVCAVLGLNALSGALRGFVRKISGIVALLLAGILVTSLLPPVTAWLHTTPVYGFIRQQCETISTNLVKQTIGEAFASGNSGSALAGGGAGSSQGTVPAVPGAGDAVIPEGTDVSSVIDSVRSADGSGALDRDKIKAKLQEMGYDASIIDSMSDSELEGYAQMITGASAGMVSPAFSGTGSLYGEPAGLLAVNRPWFSAFCALSTRGAEPFTGFLFSPFLLEQSQDASWEAGSGTQEGNEGNAQAAETGGSSFLSRLTAGMDRADQARFIESLPLPQPIKDQMEAYNNGDGYLKLGANDFASYIINYFANLIMNILAYAVTLLAVWLIIRLVLGALAVFRHLPIVGAADHVLGLLLGLFQGLLIVWVLFLILSLFSATTVGAQLLQEIYGSAPLSFLYNVNPFLNGAAGAIKGIM